MAKFDMNHNNISYPPDRMGDIEPYEFNRTNSLTGLIEQERKFILISTFQKISLFSSCY